MNMKQVFGKPKILSEKLPHYCGGCGHGIIHRLVAEVLEELDITEKTAAVWSIGCSVLAFEYFNLPCVLDAHGRAPAAATALAKALRLKRPDTIVFTYQGDGDFASIGFNEGIHAANRGENITVIFVNNTIYGMTGGQMAPTTIIGQKTETTLKGRDPKLHGYPLRVCEVLSQLTAPIYIERVAVFDVEHIKKAKKAIKRAFELQKAGKGFTFVEVISPCPNGWHIKPVECAEWIHDNILPVFPLGVFREPTKEKQNA